MRQRLADVKERFREVARRQVRKLVELVLTDVDLMARFRDATDHGRVRRDSICATPRGTRAACAASSHASRGHR